MQRALFLFSISENSHKRKILCFFDYISCLTSQPLLHNKHCAYFKIINMKKVQIVFRIQLVRLTASCSSLNEKMPS